MLNSLSQEKKLLQILDPEGKLAQVGDNSGIIYRIDKQINTDLNFAKSVMEGVYTKK